MSEPRAMRIKRRATSIPAMLGATAIAVGGAPILVPAALVLDIARIRLRFPSLRLYLFLVRYLINDSVEILAAPVLWAMAGFGSRLGSPASVARHERLQWWSLRSLVDLADRLLGLTVEVDVTAEAALHPTPAIVISRHVSVLDASLPGILYQDRSVPVRGVVMAELLADPGFDLIYGRLGSVFIPRDDGPAALAEVEAMTEDAAPGTAYVIFPEGRLFRPEARDRAIERLRERDPERAERLGSLRHLLPPRPGGVLALLESVPDADVVLVDHTGLDRFPRLVDLATAVPVKRPVRIRAERIPRSEIPTDRDERIEWLDRLWLGLDDRLAEQARFGPARPGPAQS